MRVSMDSAVTLTQLARSGQKHVIVSFAAVGLRGATRA